MEIFLPLLIFILIYTITHLFITIFYHRCFTHQAATITPLFKRIVIFVSPWITGMDIKAWCCMHRLHHLYSDKKEDPHSPLHKGFWGVWGAQYKNYRMIFQKLSFGDKEYSKLVQDLDFPVAQFLSRFYCFSLLPGTHIPYIFNAIISIFIIQWTSSFWCGLAYFLAIVGHPLQDWLINSFGHFYGSRNFQIEDNSRNNTIVTLLTNGEGYQNNHHAYPNSIKFSYLPSEFDFGYTVCKTLAKLGILRIHNDLLIPTYARKPTK